MDEVWKHIDGYMGWYLISNKGRIKSIPHGKFHERILSTSNGYVCLKSESGQKMLSMRILLDKYFPDLYPLNSGHVEDLPGEVWKDILGLEGKYACSNFGRIKSFGRYQYFGVNYSKKRYLNERILKQRCRTDGYFCVQLPDKKRKQKPHLVHIIIARTFYNNYDYSLVVNHIDGNKKNNNINNLEIVTTRENNLHALYTGLNKKYGEDNPVSKITNEDAKRIRYLYENTSITQKDLGEMYGVCRTCIHKIVRYKSYIKQHNKKL